MLLLASIEIVACVLQTMICSSLHTKSAAKLLWTPSRCDAAAVNYPARAAGITRHMRRAEAKAKCPELQCVHVETIGEPEDCSVPAAHSTLLHCKMCAVAACCTHNASQMPLQMLQTLWFANCLISMFLSQSAEYGTSHEERDQSHVQQGGICHAGGDASAGNDSAVTWEDRKTQKACLERYRVASAEIIAVFHEVAPDAIVEKASIDEAYLDVTSIVDVHLRASLLTLLTTVALRIDL